MYDLNTFATAIPVYLINPNTRLPISSLSSDSTQDMDTSGGSVPTYKAHAYTYDGSGNLATDTVTDGVNTWTRTYMWANGAQSSDSGWVKQ